MKDGENESERDAVSDSERDSERNRESEKERVARDRGEREARSRMSCVHACVCVCVCVCVCCVGNMCSTRGCMYGLNQNSPVNSRRFCDDASSGI